MKDIITIAMGVLILLGIYKLIPGILAAKGNSAYVDGDTKKALEYYKKSIKFSGRGGDKTSYALMLMRMGEFEEAERVLNEVILYGYDKKGNQKTNAKILRCMVYEKTGRLSDALEDAEELFSSIKNTMIYGLIGYLRQLNGNAELELCLEAYDYNSDDRDICDNLALAYIRTGDIEKAKEITDDLREKFPTFVEAYYHSAMVAKLMGEKELALSYLDEIKNCRRTMMTTITEEEIETLKEEMKNA